MSGAPAPRADAAPAPKAGWVDRWFPVRPGMPEPGWSRVINLIVFMALIWEIFSFGYTYFFGINLFGGRVTPRNLSAAWQATVLTMPIALALSALGSVPGFWLMRSRIRRANELHARELAEKRAAARQPAAEVRSGRARRRRESKRKGPHR